MLTSHDLRHFPAIYLLSSYQFPTKSYPERRNASGFTLRKCKIEHFSRYTFLGYSKTIDGVYCVPCKLFSPASITTEIEFVGKPYTNWKHIHSDVKLHVSTDRHKNAEV